MLKVPLKRQVYERAPVYQAVAQLLFGWGSDEMVAVCKEILPELSAKYTVVPQNSVEFKFNTGEAPNQNVTVSFAGLEGSFGNETEKFRIDINGLWVASTSPYKTRERLFEMVAGPLEIIQAHHPDAKIRRVSVMLSSNIAPPDERFEISHYIYPRFELDDPSLQVFASFKHDLRLDLTDLVDEAFVARAIIETATGGRRGIDVSVDVLDHRLTGVSESLERLGLVKDLESHIFEAIITDRTRLLYGKAD